MFNNLVFENLYNKFLNNKLAHAYLFNTNDLEKLQKDLHIFIKAILCEKKYKPDCSLCNICHLIDLHNLPDIIYIEPEGLFIKKEQILNLKSKFLTKPLYSKYNIYIINRCDSLNSSSANSILKFLEEPEENIIGFYITENASKVMPTIKSRCEEINVLYEEENKVLQEDNLIDNIIQYVIIDKKEPVFIYNEIMINNLERKDLINLFENYIYEINAYLLHKNSNENIGKILKKNTKRIIELFNDALFKLKSNVNIEMFIIDFALELRNIYE